MFDITQTGRNPDYPEKAFVWKLGSKVPEWLSDMARVEGFAEDGELEIKTRDLSTGGIEILGADGKSVLVSLKSPDSYVVYSETHPILSLTPNQMSLLYEFNIRD